MPVYNLQFSTGVLSRVFSMKWFGLVWCGMIVTATYVYDLYYYRCNYCYLLNKRQTSQKSCTAHPCMCVVYAMMQSTCGLNANDASRIHKTFQIVYMIVTFSNVKWLIKWNATAFFSECIKFTSVRFGLSLTR